MEGKRCFFIGHRETTEEIYPLLCKEVERHIVQYGVSEFFVGGYGGFDRMAAQAVKLAKDRHPEVVLTRLIPYYHPEKEAALSPGFDGTFYPEGMEAVPLKAAIIRANRYMIDYVDYLIAYVWHPGSNARNLLKYALGKPCITITNLAPPVAGSLFPL